MERVLGEMVPAVWIDSWQSLRLCSGLNLLMLMLYSRSQMFKYAARDRSCVKPGRRLAKDEVYAVLKGMLS